MLHSSVCVSVCMYCVCVCVCLQVLAHGTALLSSTGDEYSLDNDPDFQKMTAQVTNINFTNILYIIHTHCSHMYESDE